MRRHIAVFSSLIVKSHSESSPRTNRLIVIDANSAFRSGDDVGLSGRCPQPHTLWKSLRTLHPVAGVTEQPATANRIVVDSAIVLSGFSARRGDIHVEIHLAIGVGDFELPDFFVRIGKAD